MRLKTPEWLVDGPGSIFDGVPPEEVEALLGRAQRRKIPPGEVIVREGDRQAAMYLAETGSADVVFVDRYGRERIVGRIEPGTTFGEMSLLTGEPAAATVRAAENLEVIVVAKEDLERVAQRHPVVYRNLAEILAERLEATNRLAVERKAGRVTALRERGAPPLLAYALACSIAWHTRTRTLVLALGESFGEELEALAGGGGEGVLAEGGRLNEPGTDLALVRPEGPFAPDRLAETVDELAQRYGHVLVLSSGPDVPSARRRLDLTGGKSVPAGSSDAPADLTVRAWAAADQKVPRPRDGVLEIPALQAADEAALRDGLLPATTPAGRALGWLARDLSDLKVGIAFGAGSLRGYAHFGVLDVLTRLGVTPDCLAGTSIGAAVAGATAMGYGAKEGCALFDKGAKGVFVPAVPVYSFLSGRGVRRFVRSMAGERKIEDLDIALAIVTADLLSRREVVLRKGVLWQAVVASMAIPGIYPAQRIGPWVLVDGGIVDPVPGAACAQMGAGVVISIPLGRRPSAPLSEAEAIPPPRRPPSAFGVIMSSIEIMQSEIAGAPVETSSIVVSPEIAPLPRGALRNFSAGRRFFDDGVKAAEEALPRLAAALPWLRPGNAPVSGSPG